MGEPLTFPSQLALGDPIALWFVKELHGPLKILGRKLGTLDTAVQERIQATSNREILSMWLNQALDLTDAEQARRLVEKIRQAPAA